MPGKVHFESRVCTVSDTVYRITVQILIATATIQEFCVGSLDFMKSRVVF